MSVNKKNQRHELYLAKPFKNSPEGIFEVDWLNARMRKRFILLLKRWLALL
jgi:hypothetical protein